MENLIKAQQLVNEAEVIIVIAGNKFAKLEGLDLLGQDSFDQDFPLIAKKYDVHSIGSALDLKELAWSEKWFIWSQLINKYSLMYKPSATMKQLKELLNKKKYFIATASFGNFFEKAGFNQNRIFNVFGNWTNMQCSSGINHGLKNATKVATQIAATTVLTDIEKLIPKCAVCGQPLEIHLPITSHFYPDSDANARFRWFLTGNEATKTVFLELGVDETSPQLFEPIIHLVDEYKQWSYVAADYTQAMLPLTLQNRSAAVNTDSASLVQALIEGNK